MEKLLNINDPFVSNIAGLLMVAMLMAGCRRWGATSRKEFTEQIGLLVMIGLFCLSELLQYLLDGSAENSIAAVQFMLGSSQYLINMLLGIGWVKFIADHVGFAFKRWMTAVILLPLAAGTVLLVLNGYVPLVFSMENNIYQQHALYFVYPAIACFYFVAAILVYGTAKNNGGVLKFFPVGMFTIPALVGMLLDSVLPCSFLGICNAIAAAAVLLALRDERVFRDSLTGLYNRSYFEEIKNKLVKQKNYCISGIMLDLNQFKRINDTFGHAEGDQALKYTADMYGCWQLRGCDTLCR